MMGKYIPNKARSFIKFAHFVSNNYKENFREIASSHKVQLVMNLLQEKKKRRTHTDLIR